MRSYAVCRKHADEALDHMAGFENIVIRRVTGYDRSPGASSYTCSCGEPADFFLNVRVTYDNGQHSTGQRTRRT